jgi:pimeloyl-ACP methyl ester carboxylesterase
MSLTNYIYGSLVWVGIGCISCFSYIVIGVSSLVMMFLPSAQMKRHISEHMTDIVSTYGFREETVDVSGVKIHCVIKDNVTEHGLTSGGGASPSHCATAVDDVFVFIHGTASASIIFFDVMKHIPSKCVAIDLPNFGISGCIDMDTHKSNEALVRCYADIIGNTLIALDIMKNTILVAHSLGGFLSIYTAERYPVKRLVLLNPAGILPTLGIYGYYWGIFFKAGLPTTLFHLPMISRDLLIYIARCGLNGVTTEFWLSFFTNNENNGHEILQRLITLRPFYSYWNTPAMNTLLDVYKKVPTHICFGEDDTIIPSHIGEFLDELTGGEIMIHNIKNASHNPCCNIECFLKYICAVRTGSAAPPPPPPNKTKWRNKNINKQSGCRGYSYHCLKETNKSIQNIYNYIITNHHQS